MSRGREDHGSKTGKIDLRGEGISCEKLFCEILAMEETLDSLRVRSLALRVEVQVLTRAE